MTKLEKGTIIVGADGSADADRAVLWAAEQADLEGRPLAVVSAARDTAPMAAAGGGALLALPVEDILASARIIADAAVERATTHRPNVAAHAVAVLGDARSVLTDLSAQAHLLVLGSRGRGPVTSKVLGSVSAAVSRHASCPVVVCRPEHEDGTRRGVLVGADGEEPSLPVIAFAFEQAALRGQPLTLLHTTYDILASIDGPRVARPGDDDYEQQMLLLAESVAGFREQHPEVTVALEAAHGLADEALALVGDLYDLVVVGRHPVDSFARHVSGTVGTSVLERARTHVAVVPEAEGRS